MKLSVTLALALVLSLGVFVSGCSKKQDDSVKTLNMSIIAKVKGFDPIYANDLYAAMEIAKVYEGLLEYHYLKRPFTLIPNLAEAMPEVSKDGLTYTFKIRQGVSFQADKAFGEAKSRELTADDFVYSLKRLADPKLQAQGWWLLDGKIKGLNDWRDKYASADVVNYADDIEGLKAIDKYTLQFKLVKPFPQFLYALAMPFTFAVAKEVVEFYGQQFLNHPIGTGPFMIEGGEYDQSNKIVYVKNPTFREKLYPSEGADDFAKKGFLADAGKRLPLVERIEVNIIEESQPRWLNFNKGKLDYIGIPKDNFDSAIIPGKGLADEFVNKGIQLEVYPAMDVTYIAFNHDHQLFKNLKLRQAMSLAHKGAEALKLFYNDQGVLAQGIIPPGIGGYDKNYANPFTQDDIAKAKKLLAEAGYPEGKGLPEITYDITSSTVARQMSEFFQANMKEIGISIKIVQNTWPELQKKIVNRNIMTWGMAWSADYPDAENFLQLLYCPNKAPGANGSNFCDPKFDEMFRKASVMQDSPARTALYSQMNQYSAEQVPLIFGIHRLNFVIAQKWLKNYISSDFETGREQYLNIDLEEKKTWLPKFN